MNQNISEDSVAALRFCLEQIINDQKGCIERQQILIDQLEKRVTILTEELNANQLEICKLIKNND
jgi:hypothetical protein